MTQAIKEISVELSLEDANLFELLPKQKKTELAVFISGWLHNELDLLQLMDYIGNNAQRRGLTEEKLAAILENE